MLHKILVDKFLFIGAFDCIILAFSSGEGGPTEWLVDEEDIVKKVL